MQTALSNGPADDALTDAAARRAHLLEMMFTLIMAVAAISTA